MHPPSVGILGEGTRQKLYEKERSKFQQRKKCTIHRMAFNWTDALFAVKEYSHWSCVKISN
jgi:hypothetical protein